MGGVRSARRCVLLAALAVASGCSSKGSGTNSVADPVADDAKAHAVVVVARDLDAPHAVAVDDAALRAYVSMAGRIESVPLAGGATSVLADRAAPLLAGTNALALDATDVFWADDGAPPAVRLVGKSGGATRSAAVVDPAKAPVAVALDDANVYFATKDGDVRQVPKAGGDVVVLATGQADVTALVVDAEGVYWSVRSPGVVRKVYKGGNGQVYDVAKAVGRVESITLDANCIYFTDSGAGLHAGTVNLVWKDESAVSLMASGQDDPRAVVRDPASKSLYWLDAGDGSDGAGSLVQLADAMAAPVRLAHGLTQPQELAVAPGRELVFTEGPPAGSASGLLVAVKIVAN